jgi:hypothetical protein
MDLTPKKSHTQSHRYQPPSNKGQAARTKGRGVTRKTMKNGRSARWLEENGAILHEMKQKRYSFITEMTFIRT